MGSTVSLPGRSVSYSLCHVGPALRSVFALKLLHSTSTIVQVAATCLLGILRVNQMPNSHQLFLSFYVARDCVIAQRRALVYRCVL